MLHKYILSFNPTIGDYGVNNTVNISLRYWEMSKEISYWYSQLIDVNYNRHHNIEEVIKLEFRPCMVIL